MTASEHINELAAALALAQAAMEPATKGAVNPFFHSKYADLASVWQACRAALTKNGLSVVQSPSAEGPQVTVETLLIHTSGQWIRGTITASAKDASPQSLGSAITYLRRYALQSFVGLAAADDDAESAQRHDGVQGLTPAPNLPSPAPPDGAVTVTNVQAKGEAMNGSPWHLISFSDGRTASAFTDKNGESLASEAERYRSLETPVIPHIVKKGKYLNLISLRSVTWTDEHSSTEPTADDIPF